MSRPTRLLRARIQSRWGRKRPRTPARCARPPFFLAGIAAVATSLFALPSAHALECPVEAGDCALLVSSGSLAASVDLVILGDGYTDAERGKFYDDAQAAAEGLLGSETYSAYAPLFNIWALFTPSAESGADDPSEGVFVNTVFNAKYDSFNIDYLLTVSNSKVLSELGKRFPEHDVPLCLVNATAYGGSGGTVPVVSLDPSSLEIARHELGHTIGGLGDEYTEPLPGFPVEDIQPNIASADHLDPVKWELWLTPGVSIPTPIEDATGTLEPVGAYEGAQYQVTGLFRPAPSCLMRELSIPFCPVCAEAMVKRLSTLSLLIDAPVPPDLSKIPGDAPTTFTATIPPLADLTFTWSVDGEPVDAAEKAFALDPAALGLAEGAHSVTLTVYDATPLVRTDPDSVMRETFTWNVTVEPGAGTGGGGTGAGGGGGGSSETESSEGGCACHTSGAPTGSPGAWLFGAAALIALRRRRR